MLRSLVRAPYVLVAWLALVALVTCTPTSTPVTGGPDWPVYRGDSARDGHPVAATLTADKASRLAPAWTAHLHGAVDGTPVVAGGRVIATSDAGDVAAFDFASGAQLWKRSGLGSLTGSAAIDGDLVFAGSLSGRVLALDAASGITRWEWSATGIKPAIWSSPVIAAGKVFVGIGSQYGDQPLEVGALIALDESSGHELWRLCIESACAPGGGISSSVALDAAGRGFAGTGNPDDGVVAFEVATGRRLWSASLHEDRGLDLDVVATPVIATLGGHEVVAVGSNGGLFDVLDATTGAVVWSRFLVTGSAVHGLIASPAFDGDAFYVASASPPTGLFALDPKTGEILWEHDTGLPVYSAPAVARHVVVFGIGGVFGDQGAGAVIAVSTSDGSELWSYDAKHSVLSAPAIAGSTVLAGDTAGEVFAFRPR